MPVRDLININCDWTTVPCAYITLCWQEGN